MNLLKIKNTKGVTLVALVITVIVLIILAGISIQYGISTIQEVNNNRTESELSIVQAAIVQRYSLAKSKQELVPIMQTQYDEAETARVRSGLDKVLVGTIIDDVKILRQNGFGDYKIPYGENLEFDATDITYDSLYYLLDYDDLLDLGIEKNDLDESSNRSYIVNYATGEVYDFENKTFFNTDNYDGSPIYIPSSNSVITNNNQNDIYVDE